MALCAGEALKLGLGFSLRGFKFQLLPLINCMTLANSLVVLVSCFLVPEIIPQKLLKGLNEVILYLGGRHLIIATLS